MGTFNATNQMTAEELLGKKIRELRTGRGFSLRALAKLSGLNINTLCLVENGKSSPSVSTLQQLATALNMPMAVFFETDRIEKKIIFTPSGERPQATFGSTQMQNLGKDLAGSVVQPFVVTLMPGKGSGDQMIVHTGHEFVYCLTGSVSYSIEGSEYELNSGDSLLFEAHLPHCWKNSGNEAAQLLLVLFPSDNREELGGRHFSPEVERQDINMKIALITEDGKTISQHFGRAPYYLVMTIENGKVINQELRDKLGHNQFHEHSHGNVNHTEEHGRDPSSHDKHVNMAKAIEDCEVLLCGGMGMGAYESIRRLGIVPVVTDILDIETAAQAFIDGKLIDHTELLH